jgi:hypothetical protein
MVDMDWNGMFRTFYEIVRVKIKCRDYNRIPASRIFEVKGVLFQIKFCVEGQNEILNTDDADNIHPPRPDEHDEQGNPEGRAKDNMDMTSYMSHLQTLKVW